MGDMIMNLAVNMASGYKNLNKKMQKLKRNFEHLNSQEADTVDRLRVEERDTRKRRKRVVQYWFNEVASKKNEYKDLEAKVNQSGHGICRVTLAERADEMIEEVTALIDQGTFSEGVVLDLMETIEEKFVTVEWKGRDFNDNFQTVWTCLLGNEVSSIGIYGMGGVGKTTLAQCIYNELKNETSFCGNIFWFTVSQDLNIHKLQNVIGEALNLDLSDEDDEHKRAAKLGQALERKKRFVLMLDDVWTPFSLQKIGISPSLATYGFKMVVISRSREVCHKMECQKHLKVEVLSDEEAWNLFMNKLGYGIQLPPKVEEIAREMVKKCAGLSLAIITMAGRFRGVEDIHEWRDFLEELKEFCMGPVVMGDEVFRILSRSYEQLEDPILQSCFLYCSLYPEGHRIGRDELITNFISEKMMESRTSRQAYFDQGHKILNKLENVCLLEKWENCYYEDVGVKMHDLTRGMALKITKDNCMVKTGLQLKEIPEEQEWKEDLVKVSLTRNNIEGISRVTSPKCPKLSTLLLSSNPLKSIPGSFFLHMCGLQVLNLSDTLIEYLPRSISDLKELNALFLRWCWKLVFVPPLGNLKALEELDLCGTGIKDIPQGLESLTNLKSLDTVGSHIEKIPAGILQGLSLLQYLTLPTRVTIPIEEVVGLKQLEEIQGKFRSMHDFNIFMKSRPSDRKLIVRNIIIGETHFSCYPLHGAFKRVTFGKDSLKKGERGKDEIMLPRNINSLLFDGCGLCSCLSDDIQQLNIATELKHCYIGNEDGIESIVRFSLEKELMAAEQSSLMSLRHLEDLQLEHLPNFIGLIALAPATALLPLGLFSHLQRLEIIHCGNIKKLFPRSLVQNLHNLNELSVISCAKMEEIIGDDESDGGFSAESNTVITLPRLKILEFIKLPELESICKGRIICDSIKEIRIESITRVRKVPLFMPSPPPSLEEIKLWEKEKGWWESLEWDQPNANSVLQPFVNYTPHKRPIPPPLTNNED